MIRVSVSNISMCHFLNKKKLERIVRFILNTVGIKDAGLSIFFTNDRQMKRLNYIFRRRKKSTDVLSFCMRGGRWFKGDSSVLGDIAICCDRAREQAKEFNSTFKKEIYLYIIHGILHLLGYDDGKRRSRRLMQKKENEILESLLSRVG